jgi:hypothetical protein
MIATIYEAALQGWGLGGDLGDGEWKIGLYRKNLDDCRSSTAHFGESRVHQQIMVRTHQSTVSKSIKKNPKKLLLDS